MPQRSWSFRGIQFDSVLLLSSQSVTLAVLSDCGNVITFPIAEISFSGKVVSRKQVNMFREEFHLVLNELMFRQSKKEVLRLFPVSRLYHKKNVQKL